VEDADMIDEHETALAVWNALRQKYCKTNEFSANAYLASIATFEFEEDTRLDNAWAKLKEYRRKLISADPIMRNAYPDAALFLILTKSLPSAFKATTDGFRLHNQMSVDEKLRILNEVEEDIRSQSEKALVARQKKFKKSKKARPNQDSESDSDNPGYSCYLCKNVHIVARCPRLETAARLLKEHDKARKSEPVVKRRSPNKNFRKNPKTSRNHRAYAVGSLPSTEEDTCSDLSETENEDVEECHLSKEKICKTTPSDWPVDTGA
ncbi:hypothetical protein K3495_g16591, partial [Podosphaera aphanis]